ncbi:MAG: matrixin family metalloprotease [Halobacteriovoraceae bacterium]|nr:matrixin family metalloprotease [Halobacteriovoraceae bacterium]MCB9095942.1 matrixin family metalloprotease [Halobacteriovoraceae bacterium]
MKRICWAVLLALLVGCGGKGKGGGSSQAAKLESGLNTDEKPTEIQFLHPDLLPINFHVAEDFSEEEVDAIMAAKNSWQAIDTLGIKFFDKNILIDENIDEDDDQSYKDMTVGIYLRKSWENHFSNALAVTIYDRQVFYRIDGKKRKKIVSPAILNPDILLNYYNYKFTTDPVNVGNDLQSVLVHEMGHLLGLQHIESTKKTVMYPTYSSGQILRKPQEIDSRHLYYSYEAYLEFLRAYDYVISGNQKGIVTHGTELPEGFHFGEIENVAIYLMKDGTCVHKVNGKVVKVER